MQLIGAKDPLSPLEEFEFQRGFERLQEDAAQTNYKNGFSTEDLLIDEFEAILDERVPDIADKYRRIFTSFRNARVGLKLMLTVGELGETLETVRKNHNTEPDKHVPEYTNEETEVADSILRLMNYANDRQLRLAGALVAKNRFNRDREDHSKTGRAAEHGKQF